MKSANVRSRAGGSHLPSWPKRYTLLALCFAASFICYIDRVNMSVASLAMQSSLHWTETTKGVVMSSFFIGYMLFQIPGGYLTNRFGGKIVLAAAVTWWSAATFLTPIAAGISYSALIICRIAMGLGEAVTFSAAYDLFSRWIPRAERARAVSVLISGVPLGSVFALSTTGSIVTHYGWQAAFYIFAAVGVGWVLVWLRLVHDSPEEHPTITAAEKKVIIEDLDVKAHPDPVAWTTIVAAPAVWALIINHFCSNWALYMLLAWLPTYFARVHMLGLTQAGFASAIPWIIMFITINLAGWLADLFVRRGVDLTLVRKLMQTVGLVGSGAFLVLAARTASSASAFLTLCAALGALGFTWAGFGPNHLDIAPRHAGVLMGITNTAGTLSGLFAISITGLLVDSSGSFSSAFALVASINLFGLCVWLLFGTAKQVIG
jgi:MFS transporter, ACS family, solute carrier family 17 (sodium-dependent inorganic phosphate cotransporter), other